MFAAGRRLRSETSEITAMESQQEAIVLGVLEALKNENILTRMKDVIFPSHLMEAITTLTAKVNSLNQELELKDKHIKELEKRVDTIENSADANEQYTRRANLRFHGIPENEAEDTDRQILRIMNEEMKIKPPVAPEQIERSHRIGPKMGKDGQPRQRAIIVRFRSESNDLV